ncbi:MAG: hypothetical protein KBT31_00410 [Firmicutes bacterium]|nr:hypothetical protein [Candidatus Colimorpha enterica]
MLADKDIISHPIPFVNRNLQIFTKKKGNAHVEPVEKPCRFFGNSSESPLFYGNSAFRIYEISVFREGGMLMPLSASKKYFKRIPPTELCDDPILLCEVRVFLESYKTASRMLRLVCDDERSSAADREAGIIYYGTVGGDRDYWLTRLRAVRDFIDSLENRPSKMLLYYHYVRGLTVERTAEELDISRRNAYRLKKKALGLAAAAYPAWLEAHTTPAESTT